MPADVIAFPRAEAPAARSCHDCALSASLGGGTWCLGFQEDVLDERSGADCPLFEAD